jgi:hypothetical protein
MPVEEPSTASEAAGFGISVECLLLPRKRSLLCRPSERQHPAHFHHSVKRAKNTLGLGGSGITTQTPMFLPDRTRANTNGCELASELTGLLLQRRHP